MGCISKYWRGEYSLQISFWLVFVVLSVVYHAIEPLILSGFTDLVESGSAESGSAEPGSAESGAAEHYIQSGVVFIVLTRLCVFPWQVVGLLRSATRNFHQTGHSLSLYTVQVLVVASSVFVVIHMVEVAQELTAVRQNIAHESSKSGPLFILSETSRADLVKLTGPLDFGVTAAFERYIQQHPAVRGVVLESFGGQIYEGRGLARLIKQRALDTYVLTACESSCTIAFISGRRRFMGKQAQLGFHQYYISEAHQRQITQFYNIEAEQQKDLALFRAQAIDESFLERVFSTPSTSIWYPDLDELLRAGVVTDVIEVEQLDL